MLDSRYQAQSDIVDHGCRSKCPPMYFRQQISAPGALAQDSQVTLTVRSQWTKKNRRTNWVQISCLQVHPAHLPAAGPPRLGSLHTQGGRFSLSAEHGLFQLSMVNLRQLIFGFVSWLLLTSDDLWLCLLILAHFTWYLIMPRDTSSL